MGHYTSVAFVFLVLFVLVMLIARFGRKPVPKHFGGPCTSWPCDVPCPICGAPVGRWCAYGEVAHGSRFEESPLALAARDEARKVC